MFMCMKPTITRQVYLKISYLYLSNLYYFTNEMLIANPLYDHAFKYLMSNDRLARKVLSVILDKEVLELELAQQEVVVENEERRFTLYRLDFKAVIQDQEGRKETVLIELQKSKLPTNLLRFRNYLGLAYTQKKNAATVFEDPLPIISIYILGYNVQDIPMVAAKVDRKVIDMTSKEVVNLESDFVDLLTHTCHILQVRRLPAQRQSRIEQFLTLFNQAWVHEHNYIIDLKEVPEEFGDIAAFLQQPLLDEDSRAKLRGEEEVENLFALQEAEKAQLLQRLEEERQQRVAAVTEVESAKLREEVAQALAREAKAREEEAKAREEEAKAREEEAKALADAERLQKEAAQAMVVESMRRVARSMKALGIAKAQIAEDTGLSEGEIELL